MENGLLRIKVRVRGITPLLHNRMTEEEVLNLWLKPPKKAKSAPRPYATPRDAAEVRVHQVDGWPVIPVDALMKALINAGVYERLDGKRQISTASSTALPGFLRIEDKVIKLFKKDGKTKSTWDTDIRQGRNPNGGEAVCIIRPRFDEWSFEFAIEIDTAQVSEETVRNLVDKAGKRIGLLDFRPSKKGTYGCFVVEKWVRDHADDKIAAE